MNFEKSIAQIEKIIAYTFRDKSLLKQAFTRTSFCNEHAKNAEIPYESNEVLEFFGDSVLSAAIITLLLREHTKRYAHGIRTKLTEGDFSNIKSKLSDKKNLSETTKKLGLEKYLLVGEGDEKLGIRNEPSVMEDLFESIIGAIYVDSEGNMASVINSVAVMLDVGKYFDKNAPTIQSFKNSLQEWCADKRHRRTPPVYETLSESGPDHKKIFERACYVDGKIYGVGTGKNQKLADAAAAEAALSALIAEYEKTSAPDSTDVMQSLRKLAKENKKPSPEFKDLGETAASTEKRREYSVECRFMNSVTQGVGQGKRDAKDDAARKMLALLEKKSKKRAQESQTKQKRKFKSGGENKNKRK